MQIWPVVPLILLMFMLPLSFAGGCENGCQAAYNDSVSSAKAMQDSKAYYCGYTDTNCWSREGLPSGTPDPCWSMCGQPDFSNDAFQACCYESSKMNADRSLAGCLANCPPAPEPQPQNQSGANVSTCDIACEFYQTLDVAQCACTGPSAPAGTVSPGSVSGTVSVLRAGTQSEVPLTSASSLAVGDRITTSADGGVVLSTTLSDGTSVQETLGPGNVVKLIAIGFSPDDCLGSGSLSSAKKPVSLQPMVVAMPPFQCSVETQCGQWSSCEEGGDAQFYAKRDCYAVDLCNASAASNYTVDKRMCKAGMQQPPPFDPCNRALASSEHSSVRGTINGGGDFIFIQFPLAIGLPLLDIAPPPTTPSYTFSETSNGRHMVVFNKFSDGLASITPLGAETQYSIIDEVPSGSEIEVQVQRGSVAVELEDGRKITVSEGNSAIATADSLDWKNTGPEPGPSPGCCGTAFVLLFGIAGASWSFSRRPA